MADLSLELNPSLPNYGDLKMRRGDFVLTSDADPEGTNSVQQQIVTKLRWFLGEYFLNVDGGTPWLQSILRHNADPAEVDAIIQEVILSTPGVLVLTEYRGEADLARRTYRVTFTVKTTAGTVNYTLPLTVTGSGAT